MSDRALDLLLNAGQIADLRREPGSALGLPGIAYGAELFALEKRRLFPRTWCAIAYESDVPEKGDTLPVELAGWPLVEKVQHNSERPESGDIRPRFSPFRETNVHRFQCSVVDLLLDPEDAGGKRGATDVPG